MITQTPDLADLIYLAIESTVAPLRQRIAELERRLGDTAARDDVAEAQQVRNTLREHMSKWFTETGASFGHELRRQLSLSADRLQDQFKRELDGAAPLD